MAAKGSGIGRWLMGCLATAIIIFLAIGFFMPHRGISHKAKEAEAKQNLHSIQLALERYAVDHEGPYPLWISGGSYVDGSDGQIDSGIAADPLISQGYMPQYPRNPFQLGSQRKPSISELQELQAELADPLRPDDTRSPLPPVYRFGAEHDLMGNVLADPRFAELTVSRDADGNPVTQRTGADVIYRCWDIEELDEPQYWLQGQFFYKPWGTVIAVRDNETGTLAPSAFTADMYMLGAFGSVRTKGQDVLGEEQTVTIKEEPGNPITLWNYTGLRIPGFEQRQASPFGLKQIAATLDAPFSFGNPNGVADQVILVLTAGEDEPLASGE